ncbi:hypothetical protein C0993_006617 [Termitomyces sp. T159_Od127]|nr:hypothetical protein C0993_006617 [Termitomyces sp. T159_Od127]
MESCFGRRRELVGERLGVVVTVGEDDALDGEVMEQGEERMDVGDVVVVRVVAEVVVEDVVNEREDAQEEETELVMETEEGLLTTVQVSSPSSLPSVRCAALYSSLFSGERTYYPTKFDTDFHIGQKELSKLTCMNHLTTSCLKSSPTQSHNHLSSVFPSIIPNPSCARNSLSLSTNLRILKRAGDSVDIGGSGEGGAMAGTSIRSSVHLFLVFLEHATPEP